MYEPEFRVYGIQAKLGDMSHIRHVRVRIFVKSGVAKAKSVGTGSQRQHGLTEMARGAPLNDFHAASVFVHQVMACSRHHGLRYAHDTVQIALSTGLAMIL